MPCPNLNLVAMNGDDFPNPNHDSRARSQWGRDEIYPDPWCLLVYKPHEYYSYIYYKPWLSHLISLNYISINISSSCLSHDPPIPTCWWRNCRTRHLLAGGPQGRVAFARCAGAFSAGESSQDRGVPENLKSERSFYVQIFRIWIIKYQWYWYSIIIVPIEIFFWGILGCQKLHTLWQCYHGLWNTRCCPPSYICWLINPWTCINYRYIYHKYPYSKS